MKVTLIRHTRVGVEKGTCYGWSDVPVANTFEEEAAKVKADLVRYGKFDKVFSSPLTRAHKLATYCGYPDARLDARLKELNMGEWEMKKFDEIEDDNLHKWYDDYMHTAATGGESFSQLYARVASFLNELKQRDYDNVAIFAHGGVLVCAGIYGGLFPEKGCIENLVDYGGIEQITI